jgi:hypothetical protein
VLQVYGLLIIFIICSSSISSCRAIGLSSVYRKDEEFLSSILEHFISFFLLERIKIQQV